MAVSHDREDRIVTHALGSCLGVVIYDSTAGVGGLLHVMLPDSDVNPSKAGETPCMFVNTGLPALFHACYKYGAVKEHIQVIVAGGACVYGNSDKDFFQIGKRNFLMLRKMLWKNGVLLKAHDVGGSVSREMSVEIGSGVVTVKSCGRKVTL
jgi:chemotaxis protein CheD